MRSAGFGITPQPIAIYDTDTRKSLVFDGVLKIEHSMTLKMEDDPSNKKGDHYVNNAQNEPNQISLDVVMSDVYTTKNQLTGRGNGRAKGALDTLRTVKQDRHRCKVITPHTTYQNMLLQSIGVIQDDTIHYGWNGSLVFREFVESKGSGGRAGSTHASQVTSNGTQGLLTPSVLAQHFGRIF